MALDELAPDVDDKELRGADETAEVEQKVEKVEAKVEEKTEVKTEEKVEEKERVKLVPHEALHETRERMKEYKARLEKQEQEHQEYRKRIEERLERIANPGPKKPDFTQDPSGHLKAELDETKQSLQQLAERGKTYEEQQEQARIQHEITQKTQAHEAEFVKKNPDYADAVAHLQKVADANLQAMGIDDPAKRQALVIQQSLGLAAHALQAGKDPAAVAYQLAKNYGFQGKKQETASEEKKIENVAKGQKEAAATLGGGGEKKGGITLADLERMSDEDLDKLIDDDASWRKLGKEMV